MLIFINGLSCVGRTIAKCTPPPLQSECSRTSHDPDAGLRTPVGGMVLCGSFPKEQDVWITGKYSRSLEWGGYSLHYSRFRRVHRVWLSGRGDLLICSRVDARSSIERFIPRNYQSSGTPLGRVERLASIFRSLNNRMVGVS
jgi:hypothetical protein